MCREESPWTLHEKERILPPQWCDHARHVREKSRFLVNCGFGIQRHASKRFGDTDDVSLQHVKKTTN